MAKNREPEPKPQESDDQLTSDSGSESESESEPEPEPQTLPPKSSTQIPNSTNSSDSDDSLSPSDSDSDADESEPEPEPEPEPVAKKSKSNIESNVKGSAIGVKRGAEKGVESQDVKKPKKIENLVKKAGKSEGGTKKIDNLVKKDGKSEEDLKNIGKSEGGIKKIDNLVKREGKSEGGLKKIESLLKKDGKYEGGNEDVSKKLFQRVFSEDDEIVLLKGMLDFTAKKKSDPVVEIDEFHGFIKKLLHFDVTKAQLLNKIRRLKGKYVNNASKVKDGHERKFSKQHEREGYELSKRIWGNVDVENSNNVDGALENGKENVSVMRKCSKVEDKGLLAVKQANCDELKGMGIGSSGLPDGVAGLYAYSALEQRITSEEIENIGREKKRELGKKLSEIEVAELELCVMRWEYMAEKARLIVAAKKAEL
ncbi:hypothetical protein LIER_37237 [Lithospermum erythrorhizon]|uniref:Glabrous enhancer-binding protein-like DBD domain-containing protein n=1 Tax=Lithospermum erythrorhizon TaxID=34254 RepID=A0AAV3PLF1_LITER